jgi:hypothetical protein
MVISQSVLKNLLTQHNIIADTLELLWQVDGENIYGLTINGNDAIQHWQQLRQITDETGHYPLLLGNESESQCHIESVHSYSEYLPEEQPTTVQEIIRQGNQLNANDWLNTTAHQQRQERANYIDISILEDDVDELTLAEIGEWNDMIYPTNRYTIPSDILIRLPHPNVIIALVPTTFSWQVPAFLKFGNWNDCPAPEVQVCLMKYWQEKYGAEVVGITHDVVEMVVHRPPQDRQTAFQLAQEQYIYCYDIVDQGVQTLNNLAANLLDGKVWYFWWD